MVLIKMLKDVSPPRIDLWNIPLVTSQQPNTEPLIPFGPGGPAQMLCLSKLYSFNFQMRKLSEAQLV